jgi:deazaflavin-dependent oxidoreductase (nitroreductase family)
MPGAGSTLTTPNTGRRVRDATAKHLSAFHTQLFKATRGRIGKRLVDNDMLLLTTVGSTTGDVHTVPLLYLRDNDDVIIIASWGGRPNHPQWYGNLLANPSVTIQLLEESTPVKARTASSEERSRLWPLITSAYDGYREYQSRTNREIPVVILSWT